MWKEQWKRNFPKILKNSSENSWILTEFWPNSDVKGSNGSIPRWSNLSTQSRAPSRCSWGTRHRSRGSSSSPTRIPLRCTRPSPQIFAESLKQLFGKTVYLKQSRTIRSWFDDRPNSTNCLNLFLSFSENPLSEELQSQQKYTRYATHSSDVPRNHRYSGSRG